MVNRLLRSTLSLVRMIDRVSCGIAMEMRITMMVTTTMSSTKVKPRRLSFLPFRIRCTIGGLVLRFGVDVKHALAAKALRFGIVLRTAHAPLVLSGERSFGDWPQEFHLGAIGIVRQDFPFHQQIERIGVAIRAQFG